MMFTFACLLVLPAVLQVATSQGPPGPPPGFDPNNKCSRPPVGVEKPQECCQMPPMYSEDELKSCGFEKFGEGFKPDRRGPPDCEKPMCLLKSKNFLNGEEILYGAIKQSLDQYAIDNPASQSMVATAKSVCMSEGGPGGPPQICEANRLMFCMGAVMFGGCSQVPEYWQQTDECATMKEHIEQCTGQF